MNTTIKVQMTTKVMYEFLLQHTYCNISGVAGVILGVGCLILGAPAITQGDTQKVLFLFLGIMIVFINPFMLRFKAAKQVKLTPMFRKPISYHLHEEGITISQEEEVMDIIWDNVARVVETPGTIIIYISRIRAFVLPKASMGAEIDTVYQMLSTHINDGRMKAKTVKAFTVQ